MEINLKIEREGRRGCLRPSKVGNMLIWKLKNKKKLYIFVGK
jgi:hypothetical protein